MKRFHSALYKIVEFNISAINKNSERQQNSFIFAKATYNIHLFKKSE
jgi:hypothetical protein